MRAAWFVARSQLRRRWGSVVVLALVVALTGALVLASLAGARRTSSALTRFEDETLAADLTVFVPDVGDDTIDELRNVPGVDALGRGKQLTALLNGRYLALGGPLDSSFGRTIDRPRVLEGRLPRQDRVHEVAVPQPLAEEYGVRIGDRVSLDAFTQEQVDETVIGLDPGPPEGPSVQLRVVGVTRVPADLSLEGSGGGLLLTTRAFVDRYGDEFGSFSGSALRVRTADDDAAREFVRVARQRTASVGADGEFQVQPTSETQGAMRESIDVVTTGMVVFALVVALAGLVVVAVVIRRFVDGGTADLGALRGLGVSRRGRALVLALPLVPVALVGSVLAVAGAWLASPIFPMGLARRAEPHLGLHFDALVLGLGVVAGVALVGALGWASARLVVRAAARQHEPSTRPSVLTGAVGASPEIQVGLAAASHRNAGSAPALPAVAGALVAVAGLVAVGVIASSLRHLERTPSAYGYNWDAHVVVNDANRFDARDCSPARVAVARDRAVAAAADTCSASIEIEGYSVTGTGFMPLVGDVGPTVLEGRTAVAPDEVALGTNTFAKVHTSIGDRVRIVGPGGRQHRYRVVGRVALPVFATEPGEGGDVQAIADGAAFTGAGLARVEDSDTNSAARVLIRWRDGADVAAATARIAQLPGGTRRPLAAEVPLEVDRLGQVRVLPWLLGAVLVLIGSLGVGFGVVTSVRRRARDIAVLKTIGFRRGQVERSVAVQATAYAVLGLVLGVPLGLIIGRATWDRIAGNGGFDVHPTLSLLFAAVVIAGTLVVVNVVAWVPGRRAARLRPATVLRSE